MTECKAPELQDLLPDYIAESLSEAEYSQVSVHLSLCASCAREVDLLRAVRVLRPRSQAIDAAYVSRIVAGLPKPPATVMHPPRPMLVRTTADMSAPPSTRTAVPTLRTGTSPSQRPQWGRPTLWRVAATVAVMVVGGASLLVARRSSTPSLDGAVSQVAVAESLSATNGLQGTLAAGPNGIDSGTLASQPDVPVSYGDLGNYTEEELQGMIDRLDRWDGTTSTDPLPGVPLVATRGGAL